MTRCKYDEEKLLEYLLEFLPEHELKQINNHVQNCKECQWKLQELQNLQTAWENPEEHQFEPDFVDNIMANLSIDHAPAIKPKQGNLSYTGDRSTIKPIKKSTAFVHYILATVATFTLLFSGVFDQMPSFINQYSNQMMEASLQLDQVSEQGYEAINEMDNTFTNLFNFKFHQ